jgi:hypothetical protein
MKQAFPCPFQAIDRLALDVQLCGFLPMDAALLTNPVGGVHFERMAAQLVQAGVLQGTVPSVPIIQNG